jgi:hypothetical protein
MHDLYSVEVRATGSRDLHGAVACGIEGLNCVG